MIWKTLIFAFLLAGVFAEDFQLSETRKQKLKEYLTGACKKAGAEDKVDEVANTAQSFVDCVMGLVNVEELKKEIEVAKPKGALDEVFKKYCAKTPQLKTCIHTLLDGMSPCLNQETRDKLNPAKNGTDQLIDFVCYKDGDRIALFIAEQGPECFNQQRTAMMTCAENLKTEVPSLDIAKTLTLTEQCAKFDGLSTCIVAALEKCDTPTPSNMAESLFRYVRKGSPCASTPKN